MRSDADAPETEDWDLVDNWTRRIGRWIAVGVPSWLVLLAAFNQDLTGIPWVVGLAIASVLATVVVVVADRRVVARGRRTGVGPFGRALIVWAVVFFGLALILGSGERSGAAVLLIPFVVATVAAGGVELTRRVMGHD